MIGSVVSGSTPVRARRPHSNPAAVLCIAGVPPAMTMLTTREPNPATVAPVSCPLWGRASSLPFRAAEVGHHVAGCIDTFGKPTRNTLLALIALMVTAIAAAAPPLASLNLDDTSPPVEVVRCHFDEGRIVVSYADKLHVLRAGDELEATGLRLLETTRESATIAIRQTTPAANLRIIKITAQNSGALLVREFATDPATLAEDATAPAPKAATSSSTTDKPKSTRDGD